ncbi:MAG: hypothetical protein IJL45_02835 [Prevotella sp.]|nr:hypothetical protein [Prevotella sp.]
MKKIVLSLMFVMVATNIFAEEWKPASWPVMKHYDSAHLYQIALPLGGIGTGQVSLGGRGELRDWEIMNIPAKGFSTVYEGSSNAPFFAIYVKPEGGKSSTTLLEGPLYDQELLGGGGGEAVNHHGMPRFESASFDAAYPFGQVNLSDKTIPVKVRIKGFNPLIPCNTDDSSLPVAVLAYEVTNTTDMPMEVSVCGTMRNFIGRDGHNGMAGAKKNQNIFRESNGIQGIYFYSEGVEKDNPAWGTMALTTNGKGEISYRTCSKMNHWQNAILNFWDDFSDDGVMVEKKQPLEDDPMASLAVKKHIAPNATETFVFYLTWNFPNRKAWSQTVVGNYYSTLYDDAWDAAEKILPRIPQLETNTLQFVNSFMSSTLPDVVKEAALFNLSTLRSQTVFRIPSGHMMGWEGVWNHAGSCKGSCTHVWNYEVATPFLFGDLARTMRDVEFNYATRENGYMSFRANLPLSEASTYNNVAADGQMGCIMKMYREWQLSGDNKFLSDNWGQVKKVLSFAWTEKGWDGNQDGVMEGSQHNTMDVNYFGPNPQMGFWYMGALRAAEEMAIAMKDKPFAKKCRTLFEKGSKWMDANLFNGEYYEHKITDPETFEYLDMDNPDVKIPDFQLGKGCLVDQLVGQYMAHICGLGYLGDKNHIKTTLQSIMKYNYLPDFGRHFNNMRTFVYAKEAGLVMGSWPKGRLEVPFPYFNEAMTGFEYCAAVGMMYEGLTSDGLKCFKAVRDRFDGSKRNPFNEPECGHHYARAMASWAAVIALSDFHYSGVNHTMSFTSAPGNYFWSNGYAWGTCQIESGKVSLSVIHGKLYLDKLTIGDKTLKVKKTIENETFTSNI